MTTNLFVIANVKQLRTGCSFRILLPFSPNIWVCWRPKFSNFEHFSQSGCVWHDFGGSSEFREEGLNTLTPPHTPCLDTPL